MAGIGIRLNKVFKKQTIVASIAGIGMSVVYTIAPLLLIMGMLLAMYILLGFDSVSYYDRELFACTVLYTFIFSMVLSTAFSSTISKYIADCTYEKRFDAIRPSLLLCIVLKLGISTLFAIPFCIWEIVVGQVPVYYVMTSYMMFMGHSLSLALMLYATVIKQFKQISAIYLGGAAATVLLSVIFRYLLKFSITYSMLLALSIGFFIVSFCEMFMVLRRFPHNSHEYRPLFSHLRKYKKLVFSDLFYTLGLFCHNFVFWFMPGRLMIANTFICHQPYDMASCLAVFTNISTTVLFIAKVEMHFYERYSDFNSAVVGGTFAAIEKARKRMFRSLSTQIQELAYTQFAISVIVFLIAEILLPYFGFYGMTMDIYPLMAVGYFISFLMYANIMFLQYFTDYGGAALTGFIYTVLGVIGAYFSHFLSPEWYALGYTLAALAAYIFSYLRLTRSEKRIYRQTFCVGNIINVSQAPQPSSEVYNYKEMKKIKSDN